MTLSGFKEKKGNGVVDVLGLGGYSVTRRRASKY